MVRAHPIPASGTFCCVSLILISLAFPLPALGFDFGDVAKLAERRAAASFQDTGSNLPADVRALNYNQYRDIHFKPSKALWRKAGLRFEVMFFHEGWLFDRPVKINEIRDGQVREIRFDPAEFDYGKNKLDPKQLDHLGFAGFRVHYPLNRPGHKDEVLSFLGASYFRGLGKGQHYGLSARGLAIDTALSSGEEFPRFVEFWIQRPDPSATQLTIYALLDSPRVAGAYQFVLTPGVSTIVEVRMRLFLRAQVGKLGVAPLTSMFFFGATQPSKDDDYRPEVHDSDGLSVWSGTGEWLWRPLVNPKLLLVTSFAQSNPKAFGLMQRQRKFCHYEDLEAHYELRPSAWVQPGGKWDAGRVELVEIPEPNETNDNIVAYWVPSHAPGPKEPYETSYRILWQKNVEARPPHAWVAQTRRGQGYIAQPDNSIEFHIDFVGPALKHVPAAHLLKPSFSCDANAEILESHVSRNREVDGWRATVRLRRHDDSKPVELRGFVSSGRADSETWSYILPPD